ncbi:hypothetical protein MSG28_014129 [Choristoneura fumiferana]|uniref:Uncharacterized protein n=2 Tax=Choristoneura fumiferana TaxID=7141 RepID=A0ACC0JFX2_CHOFU|nr:hypothetical protein MSG28_014129 [Choristoneura fumiferana]
MCSILNKNAILTGPVDSLCLACEDHLRGDEDAVQHIAKPIHKKNLEATSFYDKYKDDHVRKVKKGYYCEYCNMFLKTSAKVGPHVNEARHCERKASQPLKREGNSVVAFEKVFIPENAWHGLTDDTCCVCDAEFDNALLHKTGTAHILNLVLAEIEITDGNVFRKVDDSTFQCLTCNVVWAIKDMPVHFDGADHKEQYKKCCNSAENVIKPKKETPDLAKVEKQNKKPENDAPIYETPKKEPPEAVKEDNHSVKSEKGAPKDETSKKTPEKEIPKGVETKKTPEVANEKAKDCEKKLETDKKPESKKNKAASSSAKRDEMSKMDKEICDALGANNYIATNVNGGLWCILCDWAMDKKAVQSHLNSKHHLTILKMHREREAKNNPENEKGTDDNKDDESKCKEKPDETSKLDQKEKNKSKIVDAADTFQKNNIKLDMVNGSAYCRVCSNSVDYDFDVIKNHIDEHKKAPKPEKAKKNENLKSFANSAEKKSISLVTSPVHINGNADKPRHEKDEESKQRKDKESKQDENKESKQEKDKESKQVIDKVSKQDKDKEPSQDSEQERKKYAKDNNLNYNKEANTAFCSVCLTKVPPALKNMKEHINGVSHKNKVAQSKVKPINIKHVVTKVSSQKFIDNAVTIETFFYIDVVINEKYCLNIISFFMMTKIGNQVRCQACEVNLAQSQIDTHKNTPRHERVMNETPVVSSEQSEFIRECRPNVFHCGFCNQLESPWASMEKHLQSTAHREAKTSSYWRLQSHLPDIMQHRTRQTMNFMLFNRMLQVFDD